MKKQILLIMLSVYSLTILGQTQTSTKKDRLDFAKTYFELGGNIFPSFTGKSMSNGEVNSFTHPESFHSYLNWGGFHFWGHAEFYVSIPLHQFNFSTNDEMDFKLTNGVVTGARLLPWAYKEKKLRPYVGASWSSLDFKQIIKPDEDQPTLEKNFALVTDVGVLYGFNHFAARLGVNYYPNNKWNYPITRTNFQEIKTPKYSIQLGLMYTFEQSKNKNQKTNERWNSYPNISPIGWKANRGGDFFVGIGPSSSFSLSQPTYNKENYPFLNQKQLSAPYFDVSVGYQWNKAGLFTALSFRNPNFENKAYGVNQTIKKTSLALEVNKFLTDYSGFVPFLGLSVSADRIQFHEETETQNRSLVFKQIEPGINFGWDILPGKTDEFLILRTNFRWYPLSSFDIDGKKFDFSQLEYDLIQVIFYPGRFVQSRKNVK